MSMLNEVAGHSALVDYISSNCFDPWIGTPYERYRYMDNKQKGEYGERLVSLLFETLGSKVERAITSTACYDRLIDGMKVEIKFSLAHTDNKNMRIKPDCFTMNHVAVGKDWDRLVFVGVNPTTHKNREVFMTKEMFVAALESGEFFSSQQGGKNGGNDDYMIAGPKLIRLIESEFVKDIAEW